MGGIFGDASEMLWWLDSTIPQWLELRRAELHKPYLGNGSTKL